MKTSDVLTIGFCFLFVWFIVIPAMTEDIRPEKVKWVEDVRNGCVVQQQFPIYNEQDHITKAEYAPKILTIYKCKGDVAAALIRSKEDVK